MPFSLITDRFSLAVLCGPWKQYCKLVYFEPTAGIAKAWIESFDLSVDGVLPLEADAHLGQQWVMPALVAVLLQQESGGKC